MNVFENNNQSQLEDLEGYRRRDYVVNLVDNLGLNFDWGKHQELLDRIEKIAEGSESHLADSVEIAKCIGLLWEELAEKINFKGITKEEIQLAAIFHDIGKTGPVGASPAQQKMIASLFENKTVKVTPEMSLREYVMTSQGESAQETVDTLDELGLKLDVDADTSADEPNREGTVIAFFRHHVDWTYKILSQEAKKEGNGKITENLALIAGSHHLLEDKNPAEIYEATSIESEESVDSSAILRSSKVLSMFDQYHALRERGGKSHHAAISILQEKVKNNTKVISKRSFIKTLEVMKNNTEKLESVITQLDPEKLTVLSGSSVGK